MDKNILAPMVYAVAQGLLFCGIIHGITPAKEETITQRNGTMLEKARKSAIILNDYLRCGQNNKSTILWVL